MKFSFTSKEMQLELQLKGAILSNKGHTINNSDKFEISFDKKMPEDMRLACEKIVALAVELENEYRYKKRWLRFFCPETKHYKAEQLCNLAKNIKKIYKNSNEEQPVKFNDWKPCIDKALSDKKLTRSMLTSRTKNLLTNIQQGHTEKGTLNPNVENTMEQKSEARIKKKRFW